MNKFADKIQAATLADAIAWHESSEKTIFCVNFLDAFSVNQIDSFWQDALESHFDLILRRES